MDPGFFENMGFPSWSVRQFLRKHRKVILPKGRVLRKVRGINEIDFLYGLADAIGAETTEARRNSSGWKRTVLCAEACLRVLERIDGEGQIAGRLSDSEIGAVISQGIPKA
jgi:hypothetical protein